MRRLRKLPPLYPKNDSRNLRRAVDLLAQLRKLAQEGSRSTAPRATGGAWKGEVTMLQISVYGYDTSTGVYVIPAQLVEGATLAEAAVKAKQLLDQAVAQFEAAAAVTAATSAVDAPPQEDLILRKAEEFTRTEVVGLEAWLTAVEQRDFGKARAILRTGLLAEHYRSLLHEDPDKITVAQWAQLRLLLDEFDRALQLIGGPARPYP